MLDRMIEAARAVAVVMAKARAKSLEQEAKRQVLEDGVPTDLVGFRFEGGPPRGHGERWLDDPDMEGWEPL